MLRRTLVLITLLAAACSASQPAATQAPMAVDADEPETAEPLEKSVFARTPQGTLTEEKIQRILAAPLELELPARVGVLPIIEAEDWRGPSPEYAKAPAGLSKFAKKLPADDGFATVTEMMPIPSGALGMEALREVAARYKLRYLLLYREHADRTKRANGIAAGYATIVGAFVLPGSTLEVDGYAEASLFDVKTGLLLFTVRQRLEDSRRSTVWQRERKLNDMREKLAVEAADALAKQTRTALAQLQTSVDRSAVDASIERRPTQTDSAVVGAPE